jgi:hypothetical protein
MPGSRLGNSTDESNPAVDDISGMATLADLLNPLCSC